MPAPFSTKDAPPVDGDLLKGTWWFPLRKFMPGWGLPVRWQGWAVLGGYVALIAGAAPLFARSRLNGWFIAYVLGLTAALTAVVVKKGEPPR